MSIGIKAVADTLEKYVKSIEYPKAGKPQKFLKITKDGSGQYTLGTTEKYSEKKCNFAKIAKSFKNKDAASFKAGSIATQMRTTLNGNDKLNDVVRIQKAFAKLSGAGLKNPAATKSKGIWARFWSLFCANPVKKQAEADKAHFDKINKSLKREIKDMQARANGALPNDFVKGAGLKIDQANLEKRKEKIEKFIDDKKVNDKKAGELKAPIKAELKAVKKKIAKIAKQPVINPSIPPQVNPYIPPQVNPYISQTNTNTQPQNFGPGVQPPAATGAGTPAPYFNPAATGAGTPAAPYLNPAATGAGTPAAPYFNPATTGAPLASQYMQPGGIPAAGYYYQPQMSLSALSEETRKVFSK